MYITTSTDTRLDDAALVRLMARNQGDALNDLYDRYVHLVYSIVLNSVGDQAIADEIVQDVFTLIWEKAQTYDASIAKVSTWLSSIARYRAIDELRRMNVRPEKTSISWAEISENIRLPNAPGPEEATEFSWSQKHVREAIATLTEEQREVLALAYYRGYTHSEIAEVLDIPLGTVKSRVRSAMQKLRSILDDTMMDGSGRFW